MRSKYISDRYHQPKDQIALLDAENGNKKKNDDNKDDNKDNSESPSIVLDGMIQQLRVCLRVGYHLAEVNRLPDLL